MDSSKKKRKLTIAVLAGFITALTIYSAINGLNQQIAQQNSLINDMKKNMSQGATSIPNSINAMTQNRNAVVAKADIPAGTIVTEEMVVLNELKYDKSDAIKDLDGAIGKKTRLPIKATQVFQKDFVIGEDNITFNIPAGYRAITIPVEYLQGLASYIKVGSSVDIISTLKDPTSRPSIIAENVKIISLETPSQLVVDVNRVSSTEAKAITFKIPASKSSELVSAMMAGKLQLVLRGETDQSTAATIQPKTRYRKTTKIQNNYLGTTLPTIPSNLNGLQGLFNQGGLPSADIPKPKAQQSVEFIQANSKTEVNFDNE